MAKRRKLETMAVDLEKLMLDMADWLQRLAADYSYIEGFPVDEVIDLFEDAYHAQNLIQANGGYVYLIVADVPGKNVVKIGRTKHISNRMATLAIQIPFTVYVGLVVTTEDMYEAESSLHQMFAKYRTKGEWFEVPSLYECKQAVSESGMTYYEDERIATLSGPPRDPSEEIPF